ncbi:hypothetical protein NE634_13935 [Lacrimispora saccharolytica]|nr:hypothetical protein [Lacrimispora saccharolytica]
MYKEIKEQALKLLEKECPEEVKIYTRWERCIKMYTDGFRSVPQTLEEVLDWYNNCDPFNRGYRYGRLSIPLHFVNHAIHAGACRHFVDYFLDAMCEPPLYIIVELLFQLNPYTEEQRLEMAKQDFLRRTSAEDPEYYIGYYGIDGETLRQWEAEAPEVPQAHLAYYQADGSELREVAMEKLSRLYQDEQGAYHDVSEATEFCNEGCMAAVRTVALDWKLKHCTPEVLELFQTFNAFLQDKTPTDKIRENFLPSVPEDVLPVFQLLLKCAERENGK